MEKIPETEIPETIVILMAGGLGKRMNSKIPKVLHRIRGLPMIVHLLLSIRQIQNHSVAKILIVVGQYRDLIETTIFKYIDHHKIQFIEQPEALGTGNAIQCCRDELLLHPPSTNVLILSSDVPMLSAFTMEQILDNLETLRIITTRLETPHGYGRILTTPEGQFERIVEEKDATEEQRRVKLVNGGIYAVNCGILCEYLPWIKNENNQKEYYLTDIVEIVRKNEPTRPVEMLEIAAENQREIMGVNSPEDLEHLHKIFSFFYRVDY